MEEKLNLLKQRLQEIFDLNMAQSVLGWDQQTYMPQGGAEDRGNQMATLARLTHQKATSDEIGQLLSDLAPLAEQLDAESDDFCLLRVARREFNKNTHVSDEWVSDFAREAALAQSAWEEAKATNNFALFQPHLKNMITLRRQYADFFQPYDHVYDPLLDDFEPGLKTVEVQSIFNQLRPFQVDFIQAVLDRPQVDDSFLRLTYPERDQWDFGVDVITHFGFDWKRGRQDRSVHPFTSSFGLGDVRITTRVQPNQLTMALFGTMHECGHAMYEQGIDPALSRTPLAGGVSSALHESQSRMWENLVGRSHAFWVYFYPRLQKRFPLQLGNIDLETFYRGVNKISPSLIRVEADEATYNLHIMLRLELEIALMEGSIAIADLPEIWNQKMQEYLGVRPETDSVGILQDVHWSGGMIGYFPTYALGNLVSVQLWEAMRKDVPDIDSQMERGEFGALSGWLRKNIHRHGSKFEPQKLVARVTGSKIDPLPYMQYLKQKYTPIYGL